MEHFVEHLRIKCHPNGSNEIQKDEMQTAENVAIKEKDQQPRTVADFVLWSR